MARFAFDGDLEYILQEDRDNPTPTVFVIKTFTLRDQAAFSSIAKEIPAALERGDYGAAIDSMVETVKLGVKAVRGPDIPETLTAPEIIDAVTDRETIAELANVIIKHNRMSPEQEKNSSGRSAPPTPDAIAISAPGTTVVPTAAAKKKKPSGSRG
ncbi:hypothetical protein SIID45300_01745 [Candidatus Magnetaquicoccaceae bacterium FCR-1]|uniref:Uncharacterized protein n=1 Tax=Candidatus Magnetaquiglobus chichijimensis TaxID=3141448 RepID=A0ABQ0C962_9PROT